MYCMAKYALRHILFYETILSCSNVNSAFSSYTARCVTTTASSCHKILYFVLQTVVHFLVIILVVFFSRIDPTSGISGEKEAISWHSAFKPYSKESCSSDCSSVSLPWIAQPPLAGNMWTCGLYFMPCWTRLGLQTQGKLIPPQLHF